jgi:argininosuccinate synthase
MSSESQEDTIMKEKVILAYSGGLDTTAIIPWLKEHFDYEVVCCCIDCGQGNELDGLDERANLSGASRLYIENIIDDFCDHYIIPCVQAGAVYENKYLLGTSMARPAIAKKLVEVARRENATAICHGATGKGNDQIRFELGIKALAPDLKIIAPWRMTDLWTMQSREDEIAYCQAHGIHLPFSADNSYSRDRNLWHISHEGLELEDPANEPDYDHLLVLGVTPQKAPDEAESLSLTFERGVPTALNGQPMKVSEIIEKLNALGGKHGIGIVDIVENRVVGMKSRGVYETPGGTILMEAHDALEELVLDRATMDVKKDLGNRFAQIVYEGKWFTPLREAVQAFVESTQKYVTGEVKLKLYKGNILKAGTTSPYSLYSESLASFTTGELYDHHDASGFITLFGLPLTVRAMKLAENGESCE